MEEWKEYKLGDVSQIKGGKRLPKGVNLITSPNCHPYIRVRDLGTKKTIELNTSFEYVDEETQKSISKYTVEKGDIIISIVGTIGLVAIIGDSLNNANLTENCVKIVNSNTLNREYLYYYLISKFGQDEIKNGTVGAVQAKLPIKNIQDIKVKAPSLSEQTKIASVLKSLDDKIEVNRRINDNLESLAKKLFRLWCLKNSEGTMELKLADIADFTSGYSYKGNELVPSNIAMATIKNFDRNGGFKMDGFKEIQPSDKLKESQIAEKFDILVAHTDLTQKAEVIGNAELLLSTGEYDQIIYSMDLVKVKPLANFPYQFLLTAILRTDEFKAHCLGYVNGTTVLHLSKKGLPEYEFAIPSSLSEQREMNTVLGDIYKKQSIIVEESRRLRALRDSILPKLMSGAIKVDVVNM